jgi:tetratricopeptide (TPR) repeat protein
VPETQLSPNEIEIVKKLKLFEFIDSESSKNIKMFGKSDYLELSDKKTVARLYKSSQYHFIEGNNELVKDLLIQALFIDRNHQLSRNLLKHGLNAPPGTYKIENLERKYWKSSLSNLYSGYPERALSDLMVLSQFDPENPLIFERMGSAYYSMGDAQNAVESWQRALYLNPDNADLKGFIEKAKVEVNRQDKIVSDILSQKHNRKVVVSKDDKIRVLGVYRDSNEAFSFAQEVREALNTPHVMVNERNDGKWEVRLIEKKEVDE